MTVWPLAVNLLFMKAPLYRGRFLFRGVTDVIPGYFFLTRKKSLDICRLFTKFTMSSSSATATWLSQRRRIMRNAVIVAVVFLALTSVVSARTNEMLFECPNMSEMHSFSFQDDVVWIGSDAGLIKWDKTDGSYTLLTEENGVAGKVFSTFVDSDNVLWVGALNEIQKYDGASFEGLALDNGDIPSVTAYAIEQDADGVMWFGTTEGLCRYDGSSWATFTHDLDDTISQNIRKLKVAADGTVWIIEDESYGTHLLSFDGESWTYHKQASLGYDLKNLSDIEIDGEGIVWVGSLNGLYEFDGAEWNVHTYSNITTIDAASDGNLWVATMPGESGIRYSTETSNIAVFNGSSFAELDFTGKYDVPVAGYEYLQVDSDGTPWFLVHHGLWSLWSGMSLCNFSNGEVNRFQLNTPLSYDFKDIYIGDDTSWFASSLGVSRFDGADWENIVFDTSSELGSFDYNNATPEILEDENGKLYFVSGEGIWTLDNSTWGLIDTRNNEVLGSDYRFVDAAFDNNGVMWLTTGTMLVSFDGETWTKETLPINESSNYGKQPYSATHLVVDRNNTIWCICTNDLVRYDDGEWTVLTDGDVGLDHLFVFDGAVDMYNVLWFNCAGGLLSYDGVNFTWYDDRTIRFYTSSCNNMGADGRGRIWTINMDYISVYDGLTWNVYDIDSIEQPLGAGQFTVDAYDRLWVADMKSVRCYDLAGFPKVAPTAVKNDVPLPSAIELTGNYPNPFNPSTTIEFTLPDAGFTEMTIYNTAGQKVRDLVSHSLTAGKHSIVWDGRDNKGLSVSSGIYISRLRRGDNTVSRRMTLLK